MPRWRMARHARLRDWPRGPLLRNSYWPSRLDEQGERGGQASQRLESQDEQGEYGSGEQTDQAHGRICDPQAQRQIAQPAWENV
jgi:hypothetical protein